MQNLQHNSSGISLSKAAATWLPAGRSGGTRATGITSADAGRVNGRRSNDAASESERVKWFLIGAITANAVALLLALWVSAGAPTP